MNLQELKSLLIGVVLVCSVMLAGPLNSHASPADPFNVSSANATNATKVVKAKRRAGLAERFGTMVNVPKVNQVSFDLSAPTATDFGDWEHETLR